MEVIISESFRITNPDGKVYLQKNTELFFRWWRHCLASRAAVGPLSSSQNSTNDLIPGNLNRIHILITYFFDIFSITLPSQLLSSACLIFYIYFPFALLRSGKHHKLCCHSVCNYFHALKTTPGSKHFPHKFVPKHCQRSCFLVRELVFTATQNMRYETKYKNLFKSHIHIVFIKLSIIYLKFCSHKSAKIEMLTFIIVTQQKKWHFCEGGSNSFVYNNISYFW
jgi:hypothetical protein